MSKEYHIQIIGEENIYLGKRVNLKKLYLRINNKETFKEIVDFGEATAILPILQEHPEPENTEIIVIRQYRPAINKWIIEIPAGVVEKHETPEQTAVRELVEETGYKPGHLEKLASIHPTPGYSNEIIHIYVARNLQQTKTQLEPYEAIKIEKTTIKQALQEIIRNQPADAKTLIAILLYLHLHKMHKHQRSKG